MPVAVLTALLVTLAALAIVITTLQFPWVAHHVAKGPERTRAIVREVLADADATAPLIDRLKPATLNGGVDPRDAVAARWSKAEEKAATKASIFAWLAGKLGPERANLAMGVIPREVMDAAVRSGDRWEHVLAPIMDRIADGQRQAVDEDPNDIWSRP